MSFTRDWEKSRILDHSKFKEQPGYVRSVMEDIEERLTNYLYGFATGETYGGTKKITLITIPTGTGPGSGTIPTGTGVESAINIQGETIDGKVELITIDSDGNEIQITRQGYIRLDKGRLTNNMYFVGRNYADDGNINVLKVDTGNGLKLGARLLLTEYDLSTAFGDIGTGTLPGRIPDGSVPADYLAVPFGYIRKVATEGIPIPTVESLPAAGTGNSGQLYLLKGSGTGPDTLYISKNVGNSTYDNQTVVPPGLGSRAAKSNDTVYQAETDGFLCASSGGGVGVNIFVGSTSSPATLLPGHGGENGFACGVILKGEYWKTTGAASVLWTPTGR
jgi:hypothetical protein